ncbi:MAG: hypothetical protein SF029_15015 [bacterium]|nr:hypothetical protein [bacterium]
MLTIVALIAQSVLHLVLLSDLFGFAMRAAASEVSFVSSLDSTWLFMVALQVVFLAATSVFFYCLLHTTCAPQRITVYKHDFNE